MRKWIFRLCASMLHWCSEGAVKTEEQRKSVTQLLLLTSASAATGSAFSSDFSDNSVIAERLCRRVTLAFGVRTASGTGLVGGVAAWHAASPLVGVAVGMSCALLGATRTTRGGVESVASHALIMVSPLTVVGT